MADLTTTYMGLTLKNPVIAGATNLVSNPDNLKRMEDAGAAAIVYKSLFEEQIQLERLELEDDLTEYEERHAEMIRIFPELEHAGPTEHLINLRKAKESVSIPVIASLNCIYESTWQEYAQLIEETGVDGLELNFYAVPKDFNTTGESIINQQLEILRVVRNSLRIPVSVKLSPFYANPLAVIQQMDEAGAGAFVLFNRYLQPDIDITTETHINYFNASSQDENRMPLRFAGLLYGNINGTICASSGIHSPEDVIKMILAGADAIQVVSVLYKNKIEYLKVLTDGLDEWMSKKGYYSLADFKGKLSAKSTSNPYIYKRAQYIDILLKSSEVFKKYKMV
ncbi:MAG TPA: dihydroorotate dehydrogenase-like protein [Bacteroidales bacterium]|nr:dihydroorotate dehydrogenase-like protein [Bacteroidales bacterium]